MLNATWCTYRPSYYIIEKDNNAKSLFQSDAYLQKKTDKDSERNNELDE